MDFGTTVNEFSKWKEKNGFSENGETFAVFGEDTYVIKDSLKENGFKYCPILGWHTSDPENLELPEGYTLVRFAFEEICVWSEEDTNGYYTENSKNFVQQRFAELAGPSLSEFYGEVGERLRKVTAIYKSTRGFEGMYGYTHIHTFQIGEDVLVWFTQKALGLAKGTPILLSGTVKAFEEFRGVKTTKLTRCIVAPLV